jgi:hypothetical protein
MGVFSQVVTMPLLRAVSWSFGTASLPSSCRQDRARIRQRTVPLASRGLAALLGR